MSRALQEATAPTALRNWNFNVSHHGKYVAIASEPTCLVSGARSLMRANVRGEGVHLMRGMMTETGCHSFLFLFGYCVATASRTAHCDCPSYPLLANRVLLSEACSIDLQPCWKAIALVVRNVQVAFQSQRVRMACVRVGYSVTRSLWVRRHDSHSVFSVLLGSAGWTS